MTAKDIKAYQFKPGHKLSKGRPPGSKSMTSYLKILLDSKMQYKGLQRPISEVLIMELVAKALKNKSAKTQLSAIEQILDRIEGRPIAKNLNINSDVNQLDLSSLTGDELKSLENLLSKTGYVNES